MDDTHSVMTTIHHSPPPGVTSFAIYEDSEDQGPPSPSEVYEGDTSFTSEMSLPSADDAIPSIEAHDEPEPYSTSYTSRPSILTSSRHASGMTTKSFISSLPSEISIASKPVLPANALDSRCSPRKERPPFRNPSSVRAMQMSSPPPLSALEAPRERIKGSYKLATPSRSGRSESVSTTGTRRSRSHRESMHEHQVQQSPRPTPTPQHLPLVLLHVTILPMQMPYSNELMCRIMPEWLVENYRILEEKLQDIVLMRRGLLIQHPREEYDVLEERILESLELKVPRLLKCGHFVGPDDESSEDEEHDDDRSVRGDSIGRGSRMSGGTVTVEDEGEDGYSASNLNDAGVCLDCHRQVKKPGNGVGAGNKRWDIKIYAANGLMRAGAWSAAWSEMERCDVEITPWIPNDVRKAIEKRLAEEKETAERKAMYAVELQRQIEEEAARQRTQEQEEEAKRRAEEAEVQRLIEAEAIALQKKLQQEEAEKRKLEETLTEKIEEAKEAIRMEFEAQALTEANCVAERFRAMENALKTEREKVATQVPPVLQVPHPHRSRSRSRNRTRSRSRRPRVEEIPLGTLLKNYMVLQLQDSRNFFILLLGVIITFLLMNPNTTWDMTRLTTGFPSMLPVERFPELSSPVVVTATSTTIATATTTTTATSVSILTVTEVQTHNIVETILPSESVATVEEPESHVSGFIHDIPSAATSAPASLPTESSAIVEDPELAIAQLVHEILDMAPSESVEMANTQASLPTEPVLVVEALQPSTSQSVDEASATTSSEPGERLSASVSPPPMASNEPDSISSQSPPEKKWSDAELVESEDPALLQATEIKVTQDTVSETAQLVGSEEPTVETLDELDVPSPENDITVAEESFTVPDSPALPTNIEKLDSEFPATETEQLGSDSAEPRPTEAEVESEPEAQDMQDEVIEAVADADSRDEL